MMAKGSSHFTVALLAAIVVGALGPQISAAKDRSAGAPFAYSPPEGFVPATDEKYKAILGAVAGSRNVWVFPSSGETYTPNITETHTTKAGPVEASELAELARGMPETFAQSGVTWTDVRHEARTRADGARVAFLEGDCVRGALHYRTMQMVFPDDSGTSILTASFPADTADRWEPLLEATLATAKGVAVRTARPNSGAYLAWGSGGFVLAFLAMGAAARRPGVRSKKNGSAD